MKRPRILVVEDEENLRLALRDNLEDSGYEVETAMNVCEAETHLAAGTFDLLILDIMLPDGNGYDLCIRLRERGVRSRILLLTARTLEDDLVRGFEAGADDYLTKPYRLRELDARVRALIRREGPLTQSRFGGFVLDQDARELCRDDGDPVELTRKEFDLLAYLLRYEGRVLSRDQLLDAVWGQDVVVTARTVDNFVSALKKKLGWREGTGFAIRTVRGVGYRMEVDRAPQDSPRDRD